MARSGGADSQVDVLKSGGSAVMSSNTRVVHGVFLTTSLAAGTLVLAACGGNTVVQDMAAGSRAAPVVTTATARPSAEFNDADVRFAQMMIAHHQQAIQMAELASTRASNTEVKDLAGKIEASQQPEIETMQGWLEAWGKPMPTGDMGHEMPGGMSDADVKKLEKAQGAASDKQFLKMMIIHHKGAITMARTERKRGENPQAKQLAEKIITGQQAEVEQMRKMLDQLQ
ncbi:DUF305 domain-containing protein [Nonomuraea sp. NPDC049784]|uniref:DUF305 domain-containing protein n=1 Tax=Nonomuraea sp. NPDC049784 TaxID=3154361 RepID=UPI0033CB4A21